MKNLLCSATPVDFSDLEDDFDAVPTKAPTQYDQPKQIDPGLKSDINFEPTTATQYPCPKCRGKGEVSGGYINPWHGKCHRCNGRGYFKTSPEDRQKAKQARQDKKVRECRELLESWGKQNPELNQYFMETVRWNDFSRSLVESIKKYGRLTAGQQAAAERGLAKHNAKAAEKAQQDESRATIDLNLIHGLFETARSSGLKRLALTVGDLRISPAPATGRNAGCLYVKDSGEYAGKITLEGKFYGLREARSEIEAELIEIAKDPAGKAKLHGQNTGNCSCCQRELTNPDSIALGIGPICAEKWGLA